MYVARSCTTKFYSKPLGAWGMIVLSLFMNRGNRIKKGKRKVQGVPQSQTASLLRPQEEEETDKSKQAQTEQTHEKHQD